MDQRTWTEADFQDLGWHDNHVHGFNIREGEYGAGRPILDLDYICEWHCGTDKRCTFMLAPADLVFRDVTDLRISVDYKNLGLGPLSIGEIRRKVATRTERYTGYRWQILFNSPEGEISFQPSGFNQTLRASPMHSSHQFLTEKERFAAGAVEQSVAPLVGKATTDQGIMALRIASLSSPIVVVIGVLATYAEVGAASAKAALPAPVTARSEARLFFPRFMLLDVQYPQLVGASFGSWALLGGGVNYRPGLVSDLEVGLISGGTVAFGAGAPFAPAVGYEHASFFGIQALVHRTWPWWSPWLSTRATFAGAKAFVHLFGYRSSLGVMWASIAAKRARRI